jgi:hypothetical protein
MAYSQGTVSVSSTATLICTPNTNSGVLLVNNGSAAVYFGGASVTADTTATGGIKVASGASITIPSCDGSVGSPIYGITATSTATVSFMTPMFGN